MSRLVKSVLCVFCVSILSLSFVGCESGENQVIEETRSDAEIQQEMDDYDKQMEETEEITE